MFVAFKTSGNLILIFREYEQFVNREIIDSETEIVNKADIMRYELVYKFGGIYSDIDSWAIKPLSEFEQLQHSFLSLKHNPQSYIENCIFGFPAGSSFLHNVLINVKTQVKLAEERGQAGYLPPPVKYGPLYITSVLVCCVISEKLLNKNA